MRYISVCALTQSMRRETWPKPLVFNHSLIQSMDLFLILNNKHILITLLHVVLLSGEFLFVHLQVEAVLFGLLDLFDVELFFFLHLVDGPLQAPLGEEIVSIHEDHPEEKDGQYEEILVPQRFGDLVEQRL